MRKIKTVFNYSKLLFCFLFFCISSVRAELIKGDNSAVGATESFTFPIQQHVLSSDGNHFFVGAHPNPLAAVDTKDYALSVLGRGSTEFAPLVPENVSLNGSKSANPLYNKRIQFLVFTRMLKLPTVVPHDDLLTVYLFTSFLDPKNISMVSATDIKDADGATTSGVELIGAANTAVFAAVKPNAGGSFGDSGSGIALLLYSFEKKIVDEKTEVTENFEDKHTTALDRSTAEVTIDVAVSALSLNEMHWDTTLGCLYIALDTTSGVGGGTRSVVVGKVKDNKLEFHTIAPDAVFSGDDEIVGTNTASKVVNIHKVRTLHSTNSLPYLIVLGGNVDSITGGNTQRSVFALPLVKNSSDTSSNGTLAKYDSDPEDTFLQARNAAPIFKDRAFKTPAAAAADIVKIGDERATVGRGQLDADVVDMFVKEDSVFVAVDETYTLGKTRRRIYFSRALFDQKGRINSWTAWKPAHAAEGKVFGATPDIYNGSLVTMENDAPTNVAADERNVKSVRRTEWGAGEEGGLKGLTALLGARFPKEKGGIHALFDFKEQYPGLNTTGAVGNNISLMIVTGLKKIALVETGREDPLVVNKGNFSANTVSFTNGTVTQNFAAGSDTRVIVIEGGELDNVGPIESSEVAWESTNKTSRIFVGGVNGLAALVNTDGSGISSPGLQSGFGGLANGMAFKKIGNYQFVRKLIADNNFLYVLTDSQLDRINLVGNNFDATTVATLSGLNMSPNGVFLDVVVSDKLCVIASGVGVFRTGNGNDVKTANNVVEVGWTKVELPDNEGPAQKLLPVSRDGLVQNLFYGGNLNVLGAYIGKNRAKLNRFTVADVSASAIDDNTIQPLPDVFVKSMSGEPKLSYLITYGRFRNIVSDDGAFPLSSLDRDQSIDPLFEILTAHIRPGKPPSLLGARSVGLDVSGASDIVQVLRSNASGNMLVATNSGLSVNE